MKSCGYLLLAAFKLESQGLMIKKLENLWNYFVNPFIYLKSYYRLLFNSIVMEIRYNYAGSILGSIWLFVGPMILLCIYTFIYAIVFKVRPDGMSLTNYIIYIFCGLVSYLGFSSGLSVGITSLSSNKQLLLNTVFPTELLPLRSVIAGSTVIIFGFSIIVCALVLLLKHNLTMLLIPIVIILQLMFVSGLCWILALLNLVVRDIQQFIGYILMLLLIMSPISYTPAMIPSSLKVIIYANPLSYYVIFYQNIILWGQLPSNAIIAVCIVQSFFVFSLGFWVFQRTKKIFFDYA